MKEYFKNPRKITNERLKQLKENIIELGDLSGIVHDLNTDEIISGNQRSKVININKCEIEIVKKYDEPNEQGTVALGFVIFKNQRLNYRQVRWNEKQREKACITANALGGEFDYEILKAEWKEESGLLDGWGLDVGAIFNVFCSGQEKAKKEGYSTKVESPIYEPIAENTLIEEMIDTTVYDKLVLNIKKRNISEPTKTFLLLAATRHIVFNYSKIANFYANQDKEIQELMEESSLVIIDFNKAIELGFINFVEKINKEYEEEYGVTE